MHTATVIKQAFGFDLPEKNTPYENVSLYGEGEDQIINYRVSNLKLTYHHLGGTIAFHGVEKADIPDVRIRRVVVYDDYFVSYRLCEAMEGSGYDGFLVAMFAPLHMLGHYIEQAKGLCVHSYRLSA
jgi:hypothetical protein